MAQLLGLFVVWVVLGVSTVGIGFIVFPIVYWLIAIRNSAGRAEKAKQKLQSTLMKDEQVLASAIQNRIAALLVRRQLVAITSSRIITINRSWLGGFTMRDFQWKDLRDAKLSENILPDLFGSNLSFQVGNGERIEIKHIAGTVASEIYSQAQSEEQAWEEKRRVRALEEARAVSGGVTINSAPHASGATAGTTSILDELTKAKALFDGGAISDVEFQEIKAKVLARA